jgi:hypothetical protein
LHVERGRHGAHVPHGGRCRCRFRFGLGLGLGLGLHHRRLGEFIYEFAEEVVKLFCVVALGTQVTAAFDMGGEIQNLRARRLVDAPLLIQG